MMISAHWNGHNCTLNSDWIASIIFAWSSHMMISGLVNPVHNELNEKAYEMRSFWDFQSDGTQKLSDTNKKKGFVVLNNILFWLLIVVIVGIIKEDYYLE